MIKLKVNTIDYLRSLLRARIDNNRLENTFLLFILLLDPIEATFTNVTISSSSPSWLHSVILTSLNNVPPPLETFLDRPDRFLERFLDALFLELLADFLPLLLFLKVLPLFLELLLDLLLSELFELLLSLVLCLGFVEILSSLESLELLLNLRDLREFLKFLSEQFRSPEPKELEALLGERLRLLSPKDSKPEEVEGCWFGSSVR